MNKKSIILLLLAQGASLGAAAAFIKTTVRKPSVLAAVVRVGVVGLEQRRFVAHMSPSEVQEALQVRDMQKAIVTNPYVLHSATFHGLTDEVKYLIKKGASVNGVSGELAETPFMVAIRHKKYEVAYSLCVLGADVLKQDALGRTALHIAVENNDAIAIAFIMARRPSCLSIADQAGATPLFQAFINKQYELAKYLISLDRTGLFFKNGLGKTLLHKAVEMEREDIISFLLDQGINPNEADIFGITPLHVAVELDNLEIVERLIRSGADVNVQSKSSPDPVLCKVKSRRMQEYLKAQGAKVTREVLEKIAKNMLATGSTACTIAELLKSLFG